MTHYKFIEENDYNVSLFEDQSTGEIIYVSSELVDERLVECCDCGLYFDKEDSEEYEYGDNPLCDDCFDNYYHICSDCGEIVHEDYATYIDCSDEYVCEYCRDRNYFYCYGHDEWEYKDDGYYEVDGELYCGDYCSDNFYWCDGCNEYFTEYEDGGYDDDDNWYCQYCLDNGCGNFGREYHCELIREYHGNSRRLKSTLLDSENQFKVPHVGFEWEIHQSTDNIDNDDIYDFNNIVGDTFLYEHDSSIEPGVECVSRPGSVNYWEEYRPTLEKGCKFLREHGFVSHNGGLCGLHCHIDRAFFGDIENAQAQDLASAKLLWLFGKHWNNFLKFSRRSLDRLGYCQPISRLKSYDGESVMTYAEIAKHAKWAASHGAAVNINRDSTIEIRLWRGSLVPETIMATIKFTARLAELIKSKSVNELDRMTFEDILGDDRDILSYWARINKKAETATEFNPDLENDLEVLSA